MKRQFIESVEKLLFKRDDDYKEYIWALKDISFEAKKGDVVGIIGRNGSGKTTLLQVVGKILKPDAGKMITEGSMSLLSSGLGFQESLSGRENIFLNAALLGIPPKTIDQKLEEIMSFSELDKFIDAPIRTYSSGMRTRLAFSIAMHVSPQILLMDEVLAAGDIAFREKCGNILERFIHSERILLIVTHNLNTVLNFCNRAIMLDQGKIVASGKPKDVVAYYRQQFGIEKIQLKEVT